LSLLALSDILLVKQNSRQQAMATTDNTANGPEAAHGRPAVDFETIVIGAGFGGVRMMYECHKRGMTAKLFEAGSNVGGTWYWNRCVLTYTNIRNICH
jgi:heterodisulfide reductase subunit A-like polyferredoxin